MSSMDSFNRTSVGGRSFRDTKVQVWPSGKTGFPRSNSARKVIYMTFLLDQSESMGREASGHKRYELVNQGLRATLTGLAQSKLASRLDLRVRVISFNDRFFDKSGGYKPIQEIVSNENIYLSENNCSSTTSLWGALRYSIDDLYKTFDAARSERRYVGKPVIVTFTDGMPEGDDPVTYESLQTGIAHKALKDGMTICFITDGQNGDMGKIKRLASTVCRGNGAPDVFECKNDYTDIVNAFKFLTDSLSGTIGSLPPKLNDGSAGIII